MLKNCLPFTVLCLENKSGRKKNSKSGTVGTLKNEVNVNLVRRGDYRNDLSFSINFFCGLLNDFFSTPIPSLLIWKTENQKKQEKILPLSWEILA